MNEQVYRRLRSLLVNHGYPAGSVLDPDELAKRLRADGPSVLDALARLGSEGLVVHVPGEGSRVRSFQPDDVRRLIETRTVTETAVGRLAVERGTDAELRELGAMLRAAEGLLAQGGEVPRNGAFHRTIARLARDPELERDLALVCDQLRLALPPATRQVARSREAWREHRAILRALTARDAAAVEEAMAAHIRSIERTILASLE